MPKIQASEEKLLRAVRENSRPQGPLIVERVKNIGKSESVM